MLKLPNLTLSRATGRTVHASFLHTRRSFTVSSTCSSEAIDPAAQKLHWEHWLRAHAKPSKYMAPAHQLKFDPLLLQNAGHVALHESGAHRLMTVGRGASRLIVAERKAPDAATQGQLEKGEAQVPVPQRTSLAAEEVMEEAEKLNPAVESSAIPRRWLRENCRCSECVNQDTMQRKFNALETNDHFITDISASSEGFEVTWNNSHKSTYSDALLSRILWDSNPLRGYSILRDGHPRKKFFGSKLDKLPEVKYGDVISASKTIRQGMRSLTDHIAVTGFCLIRETPATPEATQDLLERIGPIRTTHYGGFYDFQPNLEHRDTAYTNIALDAHTDTTYFTEPAGLQAFHLLSHYPPPGVESSGAVSLGGETILVDGFLAALELKKQKPKAYEVLSQVALPWHASGNVDVAIAPTHPFPVFEQGKKRKLFRVRWNNDDRGVVPVQHGDPTSDWYDAAQHWQRILRSKRMVLKFQLEPGTVLIFDNWRVLHGRTAFEGARRMCGGYINRDDFISRWRLSRAPREEVIDNIMRLDSRTV